MASCGKILPIDVQREIVFAFKTRALSHLPQIEEAEGRVKERVIYIIMEGGTFDDGTRKSLHLMALQRRFYESLLTFDADAAAQHFQKYKAFSQGQLDALVFREETMTSVTVLKLSVLGSASVYTGDDNMAVALGNAIKTNFDSMRSSLKILNAVRVTCPVAV